jgi:UDP-N-acetylmuramate--alanine ligase
MTHYHFIGIGGTGLSAIARVLVEKGHTVSGSDKVLSPQAQELQSIGVRVETGHDAKNVAGADIVIRSSAVRDENPEVIAARNAGIPVLKRYQMLAELTRGQDVLAIAGTHGKTTTTAMTAWVLTHLGKDPSFVLGSEVRDLGLNAHYGKGKFFVIEADEYDNMFLGLEPRAAIVTFLEHDHPDCFPTFEEYQAAFVRFIQKCQPGGLLVLNRDEPGTYSLIKHALTGTMVVTFGAHPASDYRISEAAINAQGGYTFSLLRQHDGRQAEFLCRVDLVVPGEHNMRNAAAVLALVHQLGVDPAPAAQALGEFHGAGRRFEVRGEAGGVVVIDDYAHHPTEIRATLQAARSCYPGRRIWAVWQPHTFTRVQALEEEFAQSFEDADLVIVTEIYAARESGNSYSAVSIVQKMNQPPVQFAESLELAQILLLQQLQPGDVLLVLSAGDADRISAGVFGALNERGERNDR